MMKVFTLEERLLIEALVKEHRSPTEIAMVLKRSPKSISTELRKRTGEKGYSGKEAHEHCLLNVKNRGQNKLRKFSQTDVAYMKELHDKGLPIRVIAIELGTSERLISRVLKKQGALIGFHGHVGVLERVSALEEQMKIILETIKEIQS